MSNTGTFTVTSNDTLTLNDRIFNDLATDDTVAITFPNELINMTTGKNGNTMIALNQKGYNATLALKVARGSSDDQYLAGIVAAMANDFPSTTLLAGTFVKRLGDGQSNVVSDIYTVAGGVVKKIPDGKENVSGDIGQAETQYVIQFANAGRAIG